MKVAIHTSLGGFKLPPKVVAQLGYDSAYVSSDIAARSDARLIAALEAYQTVNPLAFERDWDLRIVAVPENVAVTICEYDGAESVHEVHRVFW